MARLAAADGPVAAPPAGHGVGCRCSEQADLLGAAFDDGDILGVARPGARHRGRRRSAARHRLRASSGWCGGRGHGRVRGAPRAARSAGRWPPCSRRRWWPAWRGPGGPTADRYRPVRAWEGGTVLDAVPASSSTRPAPRAPSARRRRSGPTTPDRCPRPTSRRWPWSSSRPPGGRRRRRGHDRDRRLRAHLGVPVRPARAARRRRQPGARGQHRRTARCLRRLVRPRLGRRGRRRAQPQRGLRAGQLPRLPDGRRRLPGRARWSARSTSSSRRTSRPRSTTPASSA